MIVLKRLMVVMPLVFTERFIPTLRGRGRGTSTAQSQYSLTVNADTDCSQHDTFTLRVIRLLSTLDGVDTDSVVQSRWLGCVVDIFIPTLRGRGRGREIPGQVTGHKQNRNKAGLPSRDEYITGRKSVRSRGVIHNGDGWC